MAVLYAEVILINHAARRIGTEFSQRLLNNSSFLLNIGTFRKTKRCLRLIHKYNNKEQVERVTLYFSPNLPCCVSHCMYIVLQDFDSIFVYQILHIQTSVYICVCVHILKLLHPLACSCIRHCSHACYFGASYKVHYNHRK